MGLESFSNVLETNGDKMLARTTGEYYTLCLMSSSYKQSFQVHLDSSAGTGTAREELAEPAEGRDSARGVDAGASEMSRISRKSIDYFAQ